MNNNDSSASSPNHGEHERALQVQPQGKLVGVVMQPLFAFLRSTEYTPSRYIEWIVVAIEAIQTISFGLHPMFQWGASVGFIADLLYLFQLPLWDPDSVYGVPEGVRIVLLWLFCVISIVSVSTGLYLTLSASEMRPLVQAYKLATFWLGSVLFVPLLQLNMSFLVYKLRPDRDTKVLDSLHLVGAIIGLVTVTLLATVVNIFHFEINTRSPRKLARSHATCDCVSLLHRILTSVLMHVCMLGDQKMWYAAYIIVSYLGTSAVWAFFTPYFVEQVTQWRVAALFLGVVFAVVGAIVDGRGPYTESHEIDLLVVCFLAVATVPVAARFALIRRSRIFVEKLHKLCYKGKQVFPDYSMPRGLFSLDLCPDAFDRVDESERGRRAATFAYPYVDTCVVSTDVELATRFIRHYHTKVGISANMAMNDFANAVFRRGAATFPRSSTVLLNYGAYLFYSRKRYYTAGTILAQLSNIDCTIVERYQAYKLSQMLKTDSTQLQRYKQAKHHHRACLKKRVEFWASLTQGDVDKHAIDSCAQSINEESEAALHEYLSALRLEDKDKQIHRSDIRMMIHYGMFFEQVQMNNDLAERCFALSSELLKAREQKAMRGAKKGGEDNLDNIPDREEVQATNDAADVSKGSGWRAIRQASLMLNVVLMLLLLLLTAFLVLAVVAAKQSHAIILSVASVGRAHSSLLHSASVMDDISEIVTSPFLTAAEKDTRALELPNLYTKLSDLGEAFHANLNLFAIGADVPSYSPLKTLFKVPYLYLHNFGGQKENVEDAPNANFLGQFGAFYSVWTSGFRAAELILDFVSRGSAQLDANDPAIVFAKTTLMNELSGGLSQSTELFKEWGEETTQMALAVVCAVYGVSLFVIAGVFIGLVVKFYDVETKKQSIRDVVHVIPKESAETYSLQARTALQKFDQYINKPEGLVTRDITIGEGTDTADNWDAELLEGDVVAIAEEKEQVHVDNTMAADSSHTDSPMQVHEQDEHGQSKVVGFCLLVLLAVTAALVSYQLVLVRYLDDLDNKVSEQIGSSAIDLVRARTLSVRFTLRPSDVVAYDKFVEIATSLAFTTELTSNMQGLLLDHGYEELVQPINLGFKDMYNLVYMYTMAMRMGFEGALRAQNQGLANTTLVPTRHELLNRVEWSGNRLPVFAAMPEFPRADPIPLQGTPTDISDDLTWSRGKHYATSQMVAGRSENVVRWLWDLQNTVGVRERNKYNDAVSLSTVLRRFELVLHCLVLLVLAQMLVSSKRIELLRRPLSLVLLLSACFFTCVCIGFSAASEEFLDDLAERANQARQCNVLVNDLETQATRSLLEVTAFAIIGDTHNQVKYQETRALLLDTEDVYLGLGGGDEEEPLREAYTSLTNFLQLCGATQALAQHAWNISDSYMSDVDRVTEWDASVVAGVLPPVLRHDFERLDHPFTNTTFDVMHQSREYLRQSAAEFITAEFVYLVLERAVDEVRRAAAGTATCRDRTSDLADKAKVFGTVRLVCVVLSVIEMVLLMLTVMRADREPARNTTGLDSSPQKPKKVTGRTEANKLSLQVRRVGIAITLVLIMVSGVFLLCFFTFSESETGIVNIGAASSREWLSAKSMVLAKELKSAALSAHTPGVEPVSYPRLLIAFKANLAELRKAHHVLYFGAESDSQFTGVAMKADQDDLLFGEQQSIPLRYGGQCPSMYHDRVTQGLKYGLNSAVERWIALQLELSTTSVNKTHIITPLVNAMSTQFPPLLDALAYSTNLYSTHATDVVKERTQWVLIAVVVVAVLLLVDFLSVFRPLMNDLLRDERTTKQILRLVPQSISELTDSNEDEMDKAGSGRESQVSDEVMQMSPYPLISIDHNGIILKFSTESVKEQFGYSALELAGANVNILMPDEYARDHDKYLANYRRTGIKRIIDKSRVVSARRKSGKIFPCEVSVRQFKCADEDVFLGVIRSMRHDLHLQSVTRRNAKIRAMNVDGVIIIDTVGTILDANPVTRTIFEWDDKSKESTLVGQNVKILMPHDVASHHDEYLANYLATGVKKMIGSVRRAIGQRRSGESFPLEAKIEEVNMSPPVYVGYIRDISYNEQLEEEFKMSHAVANLSPLAVLNINEMGRILRFSVAAEKMFGCTEGSVLGKNIKMLMPLTISSVHDDYLATFRATRVKHVVGSTRETEARKLDGSLFPCKIGVQEVEHALKPTFVGFIEDLTEVKNIETQGRVISAVTQASPDAIITADTVGLILSVNEKVLELWGFDKESEVVGKNLKSLMPQRIADQHDAWLETYIRTGVKHVIDSSRQAQALKKNGDEFPMTIKVAEIKTSKSTTYLGFITSAEMRLELERGRQVNKAALGVTLEAVVVINSFGLITQFSPSATEMFGYERDEVVGQNVKLLCPPAVARKHDDFLRTYARTHTKHVIDTVRTLPGVTKAGIETLLTTRISEYVIDGHAVFVGFLSDNREEKKIAKLEAYVQELDRTLPLPVIRIKPTSEVIAMNLMACDVLGFSSAETLGQNVNIFMKPSFRLEHDGILARFRKNDRDEARMRQPKRVQARRKDGSDIHLELSLAVVVHHNEAGVPQENVVAMMQDISKLVELEEATKNVDKVTDLSSTAVIVINFSGSVLNFSRAAEELFGYPADKVIGKNVQVLMGEPHKRQHDRYLDNYKKYGEKHVVDNSVVVQAKHSSGKDLHIELCVTETSTKSGCVFTGFAVDMTATWRADRLVKQNKCVMGMSDFPTVLIDTMGMIKSVNKSLLQAFDYAGEEDLLEKNIKMLMPDAIAEKHDGFLQAYRETGKKTVVGTLQHLQGKTQTGELFNIELRVEEAPNDEGVLILGCMRDKRAEEENERISKTTQATVNFCEPVIMIDGKGIVHMFSKMACQGYGYTSEEVVGQNIKMLIKDEEIAANHDDYLANYFKTGEKVALATRMFVEGRHKSGRTLRFFSVIKETQINNETFFFGCLQEAEAELAFKEEQNVSEVILSFSSLPIISMTQDRIVTQFNKAAESLFQYSAQAVIGKNVKLLTPPHIAPHHDGYVETYLKTRKKHVIDKVVEQTIVTASGTSVPIELSVREVEEGNALKFVAYARDLSEEKTTEYNQMMTETMIRQSPTTIILMNTEGIVSQFSKAGETEFGYSSEAVVGKNVSMLMPDEHAQRHDGYLKRYVSTGVKRVIDNRTITLKAMRKDGTQFPMELTVKELNKEGMGTMFIGCLRDFTKQLKMLDQVDIGTSILRASLMPLIVITNRGVIKGYSESAHSVFGWSADEVTDENVRMLMPKETADQHDFYLQRYMDTRVKRVVDTPRTVVAQHQSGAKLDVEISVSEVIIDGESTYTGYVRDLTVSRNMEWEGKLSELLMHEFDDPIISINSQGIVLKFNRAAESLFQFTEEQVVGRNIRILMSDEHSGSHDGYISSYIAGRGTSPAPKDPIRRRVTGEKKDGTQITSRITILEDTRDPDDFHFTARFSSL